MVDEGLEQVENKDEVRQKIHRNISFFAGDHPLQEPTGAHMTQVSSGAAPYQPKH